MGKITVKHYLNKRLKTKDGNKYPVYVRITYNRNNTNFRSEIVTNEYITEKDFEYDVKVQREKEYETELINSIIQFGNAHFGDKFSISSIFDLIYCWKDPLEDVFQDEFLSSKKITPVINSYLAKKTGIQKETIDAIVGHVDISVYHLIALSKKGVFDKEEVNKIYYLDILTQFSKINYGTEPAIYGADNTFNFYEWEDKGAKKKFLEFAYCKNIVSKETINKITNLFDNVLKENNRNKMELYTIVSGPSWRNM